MQSLRSQPGFVMRVSHPDLAKIILSLNCANTWSGSGEEHMWAGQQMQVVVANFFATETSFPSCVGIAPHLETGGAPLQALPLTGPIVFGPIAAALAWNLTDARCHRLRWFSAKEGSVHTGKITNHSAQLMCSVNSSDH